VGGSSVEVSLVFLSSEDANCPWLEMELRRKLKDLVV